MQVAVSVGIVQLTFYINYAGANVCCNYAGFDVYCSYVGGTFCYTYVGGFFFFFFQLRRWLFCWNYAVRRFCNTYAGEVSVAYMWATICTDIMQVGVSVAIMQVVFSTVHYAHDYIYFNYACGCFYCSHYVTASSSNFIFLSLTNTHFS